jgi:hypothetical protein
LLLSLSPLLLTALLAPDPAEPGRLAVGFDPHAWPTASAAIAARDAWRLQQG